MPPRYAYWTILVDNQPTAFRAGSQDDLTPTFNRLKQKHPSAEMKWFQNGKLWSSRLDAQEHMRKRGERSRNVANFRSPERDRKDSRGRPEWKPREDSPKLDWKPKGFAANGGEPRRSQKGGGGSKLEWRPREERSKPDWKPKKFAPEGRESRRSPKGGGGREGGRDKNWRPGGEHKDPRQKYKDAKKAKWTRFKKNIRSRWEAKQGPSKKRRDEN